MLRRQPTTLSITSEDVAAYEDRREREALMAAQQARMAAAAAAAAAAENGMEGMQSSPEPVKTRREKDERIGVSRRAR